MLAFSLLRTWGCNGFSAAELGLPADLRTRLSYARPLRLLAVALPRVESRGAPHVCANRRPSAYPSHDVPAPSAILSLLLACAFS